MSHNKIRAMALGAAFLGAALAASVATAGPHAPTHPHERRTMAPSAHTLRYVHLYSDARGISHFRDEKLTLTASAGPGEASPGLSAPAELLAYSLSNARGATVLLLKHGAREDWHRAPRRMWLIVVQGAAEVTASDGEVRRFGVGSVLLMDDTTGKGHITRAVGRVDHIAITIPAPRR